MKRGDVVWADLPAPAGRRPVLVVTRTPALRFLNRVMVAPISTTIRDIPSEVRLGKRHGLRERSTANCDAIMTIPRTLLDDPIGHLSVRETLALDRALRFALGIRT